jgi:hypothetical protein
LLSRMKEDKSRYWQRVLILSLSFTLIKNHWDLSQLLIPKVA